MTWPGPLLKEGPLARMKRQWDRRRAKKKAKTLRDFNDMLVWMAQRERIWRRDRGCCRVCGRPVWLQHDNPFKVAECHHVIYRSAGGSDESHNLATCCVGCHSDEHDRHVISITGNADICLLIEFYHPESYRLIETKESPCPS